MKLLYDTALSFLNMPSIWGGNSFIGYDCSGLVQEILRSVGVDPPGDQTAQGLYDHFSNPENHLYGYDSVTGELGALVFYGENQQKIKHIAFMVNRFRMIEAGGARPDIKTPSQAATRKAFVKIRTVREKSLIGIYMPDYYNCLI